jgi:nicotinamidase-related amidase
MRMIQLPVRLHRLYPLPGQSWEDESEWGFSERTLEISPDEVALVMVDCWNMGYGPEPLAADLGWIAEMNPSFRAARACGKVMRDFIVPAREAARKAGMTIVHAPAPEVAKKYPRHLSEKYRAPSEEPQPVAKPKEEPWPPGGSGWQHWNDWRSKEWSDAYSEWCRRDLKDIAPPLKPKDDEFVIATGDELHRLLKDRRIRHIIYCGFALNACIPLRDYGAFAFSQRGYGCILLRDASGSIETHLTVRQLSMQSHFEQWFEMMLGYTASTADFIRARERSAEGK